MELISDRGGLRVQTFGHFIDGAYIEPAEGRWLDSIDPYTGEAWARIPRGRGRDVDLAVGRHRGAAGRSLGDDDAVRPRQVAARLGDSWWQTASGWRQIEVRDNGKLMAEMLGQMRTCREWFRYFGGLADKIEGARHARSTSRACSTSPARAARRGRARITPWNSPLLLTAWKLRAGAGGRQHRGGQAVGVRLGLHARFARAVEEAGFPPGVVNVVTGFGAEAGDGAGRRIRDVAKVAFTGVATRPARGSTQPAPRR